MSVIVSIITIGHDKDDEYGYGVHTQYQCSACQGEFIGEYTGPPTTFAEEKINPAWLNYCPLCGVSARIAQNDSA
jgi:hypothetical protein